MTTRTIPIFLNGQRLEVATGASLGAALAHHDVELLALLMGDRAHAVDARGLPIDPDGPLHAGSIVRIIRSAHHADSTDA